MHEYISEFTNIMEHAHGIKPTDTTSAKLASNFIDGIQNPYIKNKLRSYTTQNLSELYGFALKEDQKQKIRELDFGTNSSQQQTIAHCDINAIKVVDVINVVAMTILSKIALKIGIIVRVTMVLAMSIKSSTIVTKIKTSLETMIPLKNQPKQ